MQAESETVRRDVYRLTIPGRLPGLNEYIDSERRNRYAAAKMKAEAETLIGACARRDLRGVAIRAPVRILYRWYEPSRRRDKSNICAYGRKVIEDALVRCHVLMGDGWAEIEDFRDLFCVDNKAPRVEVWLTTDADVWESLLCGGI